MQLQAQGSQRVRGSLAERPVKVASPSVGLAGALCLWRAHGPPVDLG